MSRDYAIAAGWPLAGGQVLGFVPPVGPTYLPGSPAIAGGTVRVIAGYTGRAIQVARDSDNTTLDINLIGDVLDAATMWAFIGSGGGQVATVYDQTGNGNHLVNSSTPANRPRIAPQANTNNLIGGVPTMRANWDYIRTTQPKPFKLPAAFATTKQSLSVFMGVRPQSCNYKASYFEVGVTTSPTTPGNFALTTDDQVTAGDGQFNWGFGVNNGLFLSSGLVTRTQPVVLGLVGSAAASKIWCDGVSYSGAAPANNATTAGVLMSSAYGATTPYALAGGDLLSFAIYKSTLVDSDAALVRAALIPGTAATNAGLIAADGDSIMQGIMASYGQNLLLQGDSALKYPCDEFNNGLSGQYVQYMYSRFSTRTQLLYNAAKSKNVYFLWGGSNDLVVGGTSPVNLWNNYYLPLIQAAKAQGFKIVCGTILPRGDASTALQNAILTFNSTYIKGLGVSGGYIDAVADFASDATMGAQATTSNTTYYWTDTIHPVNAGYTLLVPYYTAAMNSVL